MYLWRHKIEIRVCGVFVYPKQFFIMFGTTHHGFLWVAPTILAMLHRGLLQFDLLRLVQTVPCFLAICQIFLKLFKISLDSLLFFKLPFSQLLFYIDRQLLKEALLLSLAGRCRFIIQRMAAWRVAFSLITEIWISVPCLLGCEHLNSINNITIVIELEEVEWVGAIFVGDIEMEVLFDFLFTRHILSQSVICMPLLESHLLFKVENVYLRRPAIKIALLAEPRVLSLHIRCLGTTKIRNFS